MSVEVKVGDLLASECQTLVNTVNTVGVMGKGIAAAFRDRFPAMYKDYKRRCEITDPSDPEKVQLGRPYLYRHPPSQLSLDSELAPAPQIVNFPTKEHWRRPSSWSAILEGLDFLRAHLREWEVESIAVPPLGCGHGGLEWRVVGPTLYQRCVDFGIPVELYAPLGTTPDELDVEFLSGQAFEAEGDAGKLDVGDAGLAVAIERLQESRVAGHLTESDLRSVAYFLSASGYPRDSNIDWGDAGLNDDAFRGSLNRIIRNDLVRKRARGGATDFTAGSTVADLKRLFLQSLERNASTIDTALESFLATRKWSTVAPSVHFLSMRGLSESEIAARLVDVGKRRNPDRAQKDAREVLDALEHTSLPSAVG